MPISNPVLLIECDICEADTFIPLKHGKFQLWVKPSAKTIDESIAKMGFVKKKGMIICTHCVKVVAYE